MTPALFPSKQSPDHITVLSDARRLTALEDAGLLDSEIEEEFDRAARLATQIIGVPVGLFSVVDDKRQFFKAQCGLAADVAEARGTALSHSFCQYVVSEDATLAVSDAREHVLLKDNGAVADLDVIAYIGAPVRGPDGAVLGSLCAIDSKPRDWRAADKAALEDLAAMLETEIFLRSQVDERQLLLDELDHRIKNLFATVSAMITLSSRQADTVDDLALALRGRLDAMGLAHQLVRPAIMEDWHESSGADLSDIIHTLVAPQLTEKSTQLFVDGCELHVGVQAASQVALVVHELATNAAKYGALSALGGSVHVNWSIDGDALHLVWTEKDGPVVDTAPVEKGFGSRLIDMTVTAKLGGRMETQWHKDGAEHHLWFSRERLND